MGLPLGMVNGEDLKKGWASELWVFVWWPCWLLLVNSAKGLDRGGEGGQHVASFPNHRFGIGGHPQRLGCLGGDSKRGP